MLSRVQISQQIGLDAMGYPRRVFACLFVAPVVLLIVHCDAPSSMGIFNAKLTAYDGAEIGPERFSHDGSLFATERATRIFTFDEANGRDIWIEIEGRLRSSQVIALGDGHAQMFVSRPEATLRTKRVWRASSGTIVVVSSDEANLRIDIKDAHLIPESPIAEVLPFPLSLLVEKNVATGRLVLDGSAELRLEKPSP